MIDPTDSYAYIGTKTGDIVEISLTHNLFKRIGPTKKLFSQGVNTIQLLSNSDLLLGAGDGTIAKVGSAELKIKELLRLNEGSVIELDRLAGDPLDILINGTMIAKGEVVMVGERFGIRFVEIVDPQKRIESVK